MRLIDADALKFKWVDIFDSSYGDDCAKIFKKAVDNAPTVTPDMAQVLAYESGKASAERPTGKWLSPYSVDIANECSICHIKLPIIKEFYHYCPNCGADMREDTDDESEDD